jgi:hypothetical protein
MLSTWFDAILRVAHVKRALARLEGRRYPLTLPERPAGERALLAAEAALGQPLDAHYREFLEVGDGWRGLYAHVTLFGTADLLGSPRMARARRLQAALGLDPTLLPIACGDIDLFVQTPTGAVIWYAREEIERYPDFAGFLAAMLDANQDLITMTGFSRRFDTVHLGEGTAAFFAD